MQVQAPIWCWFSSFSMPSSSSSSIPVHNIKAVVLFHRIICVFWLGFGYSIALPPSLSLSLCVFSIRFLYSSSTALLLLWTKISDFLLYTQRAHFRQYLWTNTHKTPYTERESVSEADNVKSNNKVGKLHNTRKSKMWNDNCYYSID